MEAFLQSSFSEVPDVRNKYMKSRQREHSIIRSCEKQDTVIENIKGTDVLKAGSLT